MFILSEAALYGESAGHILQFKIRILNLCNLAIENLAIENKNSFC